MHEAGTKRGESCQKYDRQYVLIYVYVFTKNPACPVAYQCNAEHPQDRTDDIINHESAVRHMAHSCKRRADGAYNRHEARQDDGLAAMSVKECLRFLNI